jgi:hypothetical protein
MLIWEIARHIVYEDTKNILMCTFSKGTRPILLKLFFQQRDQSKRYLIELNPEVPIIAELPLSSVN